MRNRERAFESCRTRGWMRKLLHSPWRNVSPLVQSPEAGIITPAMILLCYQSSMMFSPSYAHTNWGAPTSVRQRLKLFQQLPLATHWGVFWSQKGDRIPMEGIASPPPCSPVLFKHSNRDILTVKRKMRRKEQRLCSALWRRSDFWF